MDNWLDQVRGVIITRRLITRPLSGGDCGGGESDGLARTKRRTDNTRGNVFLKRSARFSGRPEIIGRRARGGAEKGKVEKWPPMGLAAGLGGSDGRRSLLSRQNVKTGRLKCRCEKQGLKK